MLIDGFNVSERSWTVVNKVLVEILYIILVLNDDSNTKCNIER